MSSTTTQLIDANGEFIGTLPVDETDVSLSSYRTVAVVGCQSGGKSTLLNHLFGTKFPVLDAPRRGRRRTTLGVWGAIAGSDAPNIAHDTHLPENARYIVLDVEGTDSRERGEGAKTFENRTALFTLALSDCVLVNMWAHDIGRHSAANYELFDTVFAHALALRQRWLKERNESVGKRGNNNTTSTGSGGALLSGRPVHIIIVVRDHDGEAPASRIRSVLMGDLENIWHDLRAGDVAMDQVFNIDVVALPHMNYAPGAFKSGVNDLSYKLNRLLFPRQSSSSNYLAPLGGFDALAAQVWTAVSACAGGGMVNGLDLPRQAALAAHFKCGEIVRLLWDSTTDATGENGEVGQSVQALRIDVETNWQAPLSDFGERMRYVADRAISLYDEKTVGYKGTEAVSQRRLEFGVSVLDKLQEIRQRYISICWDFCMNGFDDDFRPMLGGTRGFERNARRLAKTFVSQYRNFIQQADIPNVLTPFERVQQQQQQQSAESNALLEADGGGPASEDSDLADGAEEVDVVGLQFDHIDEVDPLDDITENDHEHDQWSVDRFKAVVLQKIDERKRMGELMLPGGAGFGPAAAPKRDPWWKGVLIRGLILFINYLQASQGHRAALKMQKEHDKEFPAGPTF